MSQNDAVPAGPARPAADDPAVSWAMLSPAASGAEAGTGESVDDALSCPGCGAALAGDDTFDRYRVCPSCDRHFPLPARERLALLVDAETFTETNGVLVALSPIVFRDHLPLPDAGGDPARARESLAGPAAGLGEAVISGTAAVGGVPVMVLILDQTYLGGNLGPVAAEKVTLAIERAAGRRLPLIAVCAASYPGGSGLEARRTMGGLLSLAQWPKIAAAASGLRETGAPFIAVLAHPTLGGVFAGLGLQADVILAEPGAQLGLREATSPRVKGAGPATAEALLAAGQLDAVIDRRQLAPSLGCLLGLLTGTIAAGDLPGVAPAVETATVQPPHWTELSLARHPARPPARALLDAVATDLVPLHGDRLSADDPALFGGIGRIGGRPAIVIAPVTPATGAPAASPGITAAGYRKATRLLRLAARFELPVVSLIDGAPTATAALDAGAALADLLAVASRLPVAMVSCVVGVGQGLALVAFGVADRRLMLQHAMLAATSRHEGDVAPTGAGWLAQHPVTASDALRQGLIDQVVPEPVPGAHADPAGAATLLATALAQALAAVSGVSSRRLVAARAHRLREVGLASPEGREVARREIRELQERQRSLAQSLAEWRERWGDRTRRLPRLSRPSLSPVALRHRSGSPDPERGKLGTRVRPELADLAGRIAGNVRHRAAPGRERDSAAADAPNPDRDEPRA